MPVFAISDAIGFGIIALVNTVLAGLLGLLTLWVKASIDLAAKNAVVKADEVRKTLEDTTAAQVKKVSEVKKTLEDATVSQNQKMDSVATMVSSTHQLVNGALGEQKRLLAVTSSAKAAITRDPVDVAAARATEEAYLKHEETVTAGNKG